MFFKTLKAFNIQLRPAFMMNKTGFSIELAMKSTQTALLFSSQEISVEMNREHLMSLKLAILLHNGFSHIVVAFAMPCVRVHQ